jgi:hypothetical protein
VTSQLVGSDYTDGAQLPNYVNGRLLVAEDLATGQATLRTRDQWIGQAAGAGIVRGLWVTGSGTTLTVDPGLAISAAGEPVVVPHSVTLELAAAAQTRQTGGASFQCCDSPGHRPAGTEPGSVMLVARSACQLQGQAPLAPPPSTTVSPGCTAQWLVEGVEFRTIPLPVADSVAGQQVTAGNRRNLAAHWCFGTEQLATLGRNPFAFDPAYRGIDLLDPTDLTPYDVPLAVLTWTGRTVGDLDNWSARRRVTAPDPTPGHWSVEVADGREADGQARWLQFQDQLEGLISAGQTTGYAADHFAFLPPVGFLPLSSAGVRLFAGDVLARLATVATSAVPAATATPTIAARLAEIDVTADPVQVAPPTPVQMQTLQLQNYFTDLLSNATLVAARGFTAASFFGATMRSGGIIGWDLADLALRESWRAAPVAMPTDPASAGKAPLFTCYTVLENTPPRVTRAAPTPASGVMIAARAAIPPPHGTYLVFVANQFWPAATAAVPQRVPLVPSVSR